jgi:predicted DsbA family dithiol-disulfide isomerase
MLPDEGVDRKAYMAGKFTDPDRRAAIMQALSEAAEGEGIVMNLRAIPLSPNTNAAQRLIRWAQLEGRQEAALEAVMAAYFTQLRDIGDPVVLADIAAEIGMDRLLVLKRLSEDTDKEAVTREHFMAAKSGVTGVPFMIFGGKVAAVGAESSERLAEAIDKALEMEAA